MKKLLSITACILILLAGCNQENTPKEPGKIEAPAAPMTSYVPIFVSGNEAGPFSIIRLDTTNLLGYQARSGTMNLMEAVTDHPDLMGYIVINKVYSFGPDRYVLIVSTGENGRSCPATTYAISFDTKNEYVDGATGIDGCAEALDSLAEGNKLTIKKDGAATVIYNGVIK
ncbi:hypothetical protein IB234_11825 [Pseudomonas sp. PDM16]|uniref:hypothetical protein n=1 Tax=Pseudomonas sp. PDM16 TaxID=2769292 RepID=UPI001783D295|nr:hypothetical protein [Pseudomonas sp. PDM16]MBD9415242.1 hypothetical protein [Pseudomonas sp. PDM16]